MDRFCKAQARFYSNIGSMNIIERVDQKVKRTIKEVFGARRYCNVCKTPFKGKFIPIHPMYLENARKTGFPYTFDEGETLNYKEYTCPFCQSSDRDRLYALYLDTHLDSNKSYQLLDFAPAPALRQYLKANSMIKYRSADLFMDGVDDKIDVMDMHIYPDNSFDIFICSHVLEHVKDDAKAMRELYRILKPGGFGICMVPIILPLKSIDEDPSLEDPAEKWRRFGQDDHVRLYNRAGFIERLAGAGFKVDQFTIKDFEAGQFIQYGISPKSVLYIVRK